MTDETKQNRQRRSMAPAHRRRKSKPPPHVNARNVATNYAQITQNINQRTCVRSIEVEPTSRSPFDSKADFDAENREENAVDAPRCCRGLAGGDECAAAAVADGESEANVRRKYEIKENESALLFAVGLAAAETAGACAFANASGSSAKSAALRCGLDELAAAASEKNKACEATGCLTAE